jgi:hypothetical protein
MQNLVFPATLSLDKNTINADGLDVPISNGMVVTVEIETRPAGARLRFVAVGGSCVQFFERALGRSA